MKKKDLKILKHDCEEFLKQMKREDFETARAIARLLLLATYRIEQERRSNGRKAD